MHTAAGFDKRGKEGDWLITSTGVANIFIATIYNRQAFDDLLTDDKVFFIAGYTRPKEELQINDLDLSVNKVNVLQSKSPSLNGAGINVSVKENMPDTTDIDYAARYRYNPLEAVNVTSHASIMATMIAGAGNSYYLGKGVAGGATIFSSDFANLLPDPDSVYQHYHISVQNHSYGVGIENFYGADAAAYDAAALRNDSIVFVFSAGNSGNSTTAAGNYSGIPGYANLTGSFKMAKNILTVGAVDSFSRVVTASSRGPAFDGRVKPELVAYGEDGSSGAAALVSGTVAVLQQAYKNSNLGVLPPAALVKALLINSADDVGSPGIDYSSGYGNLDAPKATTDLLGKQYFTGSVSDNASNEFSFDIPANISKAKFTLVWQDMPAAPNVYKALVNDLDLTLHSAASNETWQPWVLNSTPGTGLLASPPVRKRDSLNNVEQITVDDPVAGTYKLQVKGFSVSGATQPFYIVWQLDTLNEFSWDFPASTDNIFPGLPNLVRFHTNIRATSGKVFYSIDRGNKWQVIDSLIDTGKNYFYWNAPDTNALAMLKMQIGTKQFISDTFTLSKKLNFKVGFNCADSVLWYWNKLPGINNYQLFDLAGDYLTPLTTVSDTQFVFDKNKVPYKLFAVAPVIADRTGVKSYTTDYITQGVACYISNFLADLSDNKANIQLQLGTGYFIKKIAFEKFYQNNFVLLKMITDINSLNYTATDNILQKGLNVYRARIELTDGRIIYSDPTAVFYFNNSNIVVFPNPVLQNSPLTIQFRELQNQQIQISDALGRVIFSQKAESLSVHIPFVYPRGIYFILITNPETHEQRFIKLISY